MVKSFFAIYFAVIFSGIGWIFWHPNTGSEEKLFSTWLSHLNVELLTMLIFGMGLVGISLIGRNRLTKHYMNPLHIYCRLRDLGLGKRQAASFCRFYERAVFRRFVLLKE